MSDTSDTSNSSVVFVAEQKRIHVEVHPQPPTPAPSNTSAEETTSGNLFLTPNGFKTVKMTFLSFQKLVSKFLQ